MLVKIMEHFKCGHVAMTRRSSAAVERLNPKSLHIRSSMWLCGLVTAAEQNVCIFFAMK